MSKSISFTVHGKPEPKGSARAFMRGGRPIVTSDNKSLKSWEAAVRFAAQGVAGDVFFDGAVSLHVQFYLQRPKSVSFTKRPFMVTRPDCSKLVRGLEDALTEVFWKDDAQVIVICASKQYAAPGESSRAEVTITEVRPAPVPAAVTLPLTERTM